MNRIGLLYDHVLDMGGVENHLLSLIKCLGGKDYRFTVLSQTSAAFRGRLAALGTESIDQPVFHPFDPGWVFHLKQEIKEKNIDLLHIHGPIAAEPGRIAARLAGIPCLITHHLPMSKYHGSKQTLRARMGRWIYIQADRWLNHLYSDPIIYVSNTIQKEEVRAGRARAAYSYVIPNGVDLEKFRRNKDLDRPARKLCVLFIGRLSEQKGLDVLLNALRRLPPDLPAFTCAICGDGELMSELTTQSKENGLNVQFLGAQYDVPGLLSNADIFVLPSRYEALPISLLEAMATGLPCLVTRVGDCPRLVEDGPGGLVVPPDDVNALAAALERLLRDEALRKLLGEGAKKTASSYSERETARRVEEFYSNLLHR